MQGYFTVNVRRNLGTRAGVHLIWGLLNTGLTVFLMHEVLTLTNVDLLPELFRVKKMKTGRLLFQVILNCCCVFKATAFTALCA